MLLITFSIFAAKKGDSNWFKTREVRPQYIRKKILSLERME